MSLELKIDLVDGVHHITGKMNEYSDFSELEKATEPLILNMHKITMINSMGMLKFLRFLNNWGEKKFHYEKCNQLLVQHFAMLPALFGPAHSKKGRVKSIEVTMGCHSCGAASQEIIECDQIVIENRQAKSPIGVCSKCKGASVIDEEELEEIGNFLDSMNSVDD